MKTKYKNMSDQELVIVGVGVVKAGQEFISSQDIINPNIQNLGAGESVKAGDDDTDVLISKPENKQEAKS